MERKRQRRGHGKMGEIIETLEMRVDLHLKCTYLILLTYYIKPEIKLVELIVFNCIEQTEKTELTKGTCNEV